MKKCTKSLSAVLMAGLVMGMITVPTQVNAQEEAIYDTSNQNTLESNTKRGSYIFRDDLGTIGEGEYSIVAVLRINDTTGKIETAILDTGGDGKGYNILYNVKFSSDRYKVNYEITLYDENIFGDSDHALETLTFTVSTPGPRSIN